MELSMETRRGSRHRTVPIGCAVTHKLTGDTHTAKNGGVTDLNPETCGGSRHCVVPMVHAVMGKGDQDKHMAKDGGLIPRDLSGSKDCGEPKMATR